MRQTQRRVYSAEFKREIVRSITEKKESVSHLSRRHGINENVLRRWKRQVLQDGAGAFPGKGQRKQSTREIHRLKGECQRLAWGQEILTKASRLLTESVRSRYAFIHVNRTLYPVRIMCDVLCVSRSGYYAYAKSLGEDMACKVEGHMICATATTAKVGAGVIVPVLPHSMREER